MGPSRRPASLLLLVEVAVWCAVAVAAAIYVIHTVRNEVNVPINDDWHTVELYVLMRTHHLSAGQIWAQWNENRMALPFVLTLGIDYASNMDMRWLIDLSLGIQLCSAGILVWIARRLKLPTFIRLVLPFLVLPLAAYEDYLWGFQLAWVLVYFLLVTAIAVALRPRGRWTVVACVCLCVAASFSSIQGLLVWFVVAIMAVERRWRVRDLLVLALGFAATSSLYFFDFNLSSGSSPGGISFGLRHPELMARYVAYLFAALFDPTRNFADKGSTDVLQRVSPYLGAVVVVVGIVVTILGLRVLLMAYRYGDDHPDRPNASLAVGVALSVYSLLFAGVTAFGRVGYGVAQAGASRYTLYTPLLLAGIVLSVAGLGSVRNAGRWTGGARGETEGRGRAWARRGVIVGSAVCVLSVLVGAANSAWDPVVRTERLTALQVLDRFPTDHSRYKRVTSSVVKYVTPDVATFEWLVPKLRNLHTSQFPVRER